MSKLKEILAERHNDYGDFEIESDISEALKAILREHYRGNTHSRYMRAGLEFICHKIARIINGNPLKEDSWRDIGGYAEVVRGIIERKKKLACQKRAGPKKRR